MVIPDSAELLNRYALVGGPEDMVPRLERAFVALYDRGEKPVDGCAWVKVDETGKVLFLT